MRRGVTHLIECHCTLPQYRDVEDVVYHKFLVFSIIEDDQLQPKYVRCNNCGVIHHVIDIAKSSIALGDDHDVDLTIDDVKMSLPTRLSETLENYEAPVYVWEKAQFIIDEKRWGDSIALDVTDSDNKRTGKLLVIEGLDRFKVKPFSTQVTF